VISYPKARAMWLERVHLDQAVTAGAFRVAFTLSRWFSAKRYEETGRLQSWKEQADLADESRMTRRGFQKCIEALVAGGHVAVVSGRGRGNRSTHEGVLQGKEKVNESSHFGTEKGEPKFSFCEQKRRTTKLEKANERARKGELNDTPIYKTLENPIDKPLEGNNTRQARKTKPASAERAVLEILGAVLSPDTCAELIEHRKAKRSKLTAGAAKALVKQFLACGDPEGAVQEMLTRGWTGFKAEWLHKGQAQNTRHNPQANQDYKFTHQALEQIRGDDE
jgi:hypothetical protein